MRDIIENFNLGGFIERLHKNNRLFIFCDKFTEVDLHPNEVDNHTMGQVFEELLRRFSEMSNETSGEHYTPRDVVRLLVSLLFAEHTEDLQGQGVIRSIFDPCCGTGGMLTIGKEYFREQINPDADIRLLGQELNAQTYAICKSDMLITGEEPGCNIRHGSSLSRRPISSGQRFDYMITNPPFGVSWKSDEAEVKADAQTSNGRFSAGTPRVPPMVRCCSCNTCSPRWRTTGVGLGSSLTGRRSSRVTPVAVRVKSDGGLSKTTGWNVLLHCLKSYSSTPVSPPISGS